MNQNCWLFACVVGIALSAAVTGQCAGRRNGYAVEITGCRNAKVCQNGTLTNLTCQSNTVIERDSMTCKPIGTGNTACGTIPDCAGKPDHTHGDANCQTYYWCLNKAFLTNSRNYCPVGLYFDGIRCNYKYNIPPPCGTLVVEPETTTTTAIPQQKQTTPGETTTTTPVPQQKQTAAETTTPVPQQKQTAAETTTPVPQQKQTAAETTTLVPQQKQTAAETTKTPIPQQ